MGFWTTVAAVIVAYIVLCGARLLINLLALYIDDWIMRRLK